jgi:hypothetical protein
MEACLDLLMLKASNSSEYPVDSAEQGPAP